MPSTVLVLTQPMDITADMVVQALGDRGTAVIRFDTADFPTQVGLDARIDDTGVWTGRLTTPDRGVDLTDVAGIYYRRPSVYRLPEEMSAVEADWADFEARYGFGGVLSTLPTRWVNHPARNAHAGLKPVQLSIAARHGLHVPPTIVTNVPDAAADFARTHRDGLIYKTLCDGPLVNGQTIYTTDVTEEQVGGPGTAATAHQFQAKLKKAFEVRLTVVGDHHFAARIDAHSDAARDDWRTDYKNITYSRVDIPADVAAGVAGLMREFDLRFGALDFVVDPDGRWVFLEINPNGQWGWIEDQLGYPISAAIAAQLDGGEAP